MSRHVPDGGMTTSTLVTLSSLMRALQSPREGHSAVLAAERMHLNHTSTLMNKKSDQKAWTRADESGADKYPLMRLASAERRVPS